MLTEAERHELAQSSGESAEPKRGRHARTIYNLDEYVVPVDPADATICEACE